MEKLCYLASNYMKKWRHLIPWTSAESSDIQLHCNLTLYWHLIHDKGVNPIQWRKENLFNKWWQENWIDTSKRMKEEHSLTIHTHTHWNSNPKFPLTVALFEIRSLKMIRLAWSHEHGSCAKSLVFF